MVRDEVRRAVISSIGRSGIPYRYVVALTLPQLLNYFDLMTGYTNARWALIEFIMNESVHFAVFPLSMFVMSRVTRSCLQLSGCAKWAFMTALTVMFFVVTFFPFLVIRTLATDAVLTGSNTTLCVLIGIVFFLLALCGILYRPLPVTRHRHQLGEQRAAT